MPFTTTTSGIVGANTITFNTLSDNTYDGETVTFTAGDVTSTTIPLNIFTIDTVPPRLEETKKIETPSNNTTPSVEITSTKAGRISSSLGISNPPNRRGNVGKNIITFNELAPDTYSGKTVKFTDDAGNSKEIILSTFTIDTKPVITPTPPPPKPVPVAPPKLSKIKIELIPDKGYSRKFKTTDDVDDWNTVIRGHLRINGKRTR